MVSEIHSAIPLPIPCFYPDPSRGIDGTRHEKDLKRKKRGKGKRNISQVCGWRAYYRRQGASGGSRG